ncbi:hypothetical protein B0H16DRAFT_1901388 [Mycena metata]|uniref:Uncharacterized protein n=1 Tax=Mycena metata TaxID=1033252 RepID=A0AAD7GX08_9AGAR|nr:hypothetical protein B0H16DRAFT_1901388 [Mycena metata]
MPRHRETRSAPPSHPLQPCPPTCLHRPYFCSTRLLATPRVVRLPTQPHQQQHQHQHPPPPHYAYDMQHYVYGPPPKPQPLQYTHPPPAQHSHSDQHRYSPDSNVSGANLSDRVRGRCCTTETAPYVAEE